MAALKGTLPQNIFILKSGHKGHMNFLNIGDLNKFFNFFGRKCNLSYFLVPETMSPLDVRSKVCMAPFDLRSKVCIAPILVRSSLLRTYRVDRYSCNPPKKQSPRQGVKKKTDSKNSPHVWDSDFLGGGKNSGPPCRWEQCRLYTAQGAET